MTAQSPVGSGEVCRLTVYGPKSRVELAVPAHVPVADLMPTFLGHLGQELATTGLDHGGWVLQRLGEPPLEEDLGTAALGLYDGDILHLRPRDEQLAPVDFDDLVDGVATGIAERNDQWRPESTRRLALAGAALALGFGALLLPTLGAGPRIAIIAWVVAVVLVAAAAAMVRSYADGGAGIVLGLAAVGYAALAGLAVPALGGPIRPAGLVTGPGLLAAGSSVAVIAIGTQLGTGRLRASLSASALGAALVALAGLLATVTTLNGPDIAAALLPLVLLMGFLVPTIGAKLAGLRITPVPANPEEFQQDVDPVPAGRLLRQAASADANITAQYVALAVVCTGLLAVLAAAPGRSAPILVAASSVLLLLHSRELLGVRQRVAMLAPGVLGLLLLVLVECLHGSVGFRLAVLVLAVLAALGACAVARTLPGRRLLPHWGLAGDIAHWATAAAIIPFALSVTGLYSWVRGLWF